MTTPRVSGPVGIRQSMAAGSNFDGNAPESGAVPLSPTWTGTLFAFADGDKGGLFDFTSDLYTFDRDPLRLIAVHLKLADQSAWSMSVLDADDNAAVIYSGTTEASYFTTIENGTVLLWGSKLKLTTTGASAAMVAMVLVAPLAAGCFAY